MVSDVFHVGSTLLDSESIYQEKSIDIRIIAKHDLSLKTFPYAIKKHLAMHQFDFTCKYSTRSEYISICSHRANEAHSEKM